MRSPRCILYSLVPVACRLSPAHGDGDGVDCDRHRHRDGYGNNCIILVTVMGYGDRKGDGVGHRDVGGDVDGDSDGDDYGNVGGCQP